ncbi:MAG: arsenate reductase family protein [Sulfurovum sp.]|nr:MAG: arsenate reductase family protein [Sulfurovum sp.]RUM77549.1 MAG: arsenate reductase family protein [Sulfurovum sp.]
MTIYGIKTCSTVGKARKFMKTNDIAFDFVDYKVESVDEDKIREWLKQVELDLIFNTRGTKYKDLKLKALNLNDEEKIAWMAKENYLLKRPIIEYDNGKVHVGYNEEEYQKIFLA